MRRPARRVIGFALGVAGGFLIVPAPVGAVEVITVPVRGEAPNDSPGAVPHATYRGHGTTLKAVARGFPDMAAAQAATFAWDTDADGSFADETPESPRQCVGGTPEGVNCYDLGKRITIPDSGEQLLDFQIRLSQPGQADVLGTYPVFVYADVPAQPDPEMNATALPQNATGQQLEVMRAVALDDALWYLHKQMVNRAGTGAAIVGSFNPEENFLVNASATYLMLANRSGHVPAYPPASYDHGVNPGAWSRPASPPAGFTTANDARYRADPYAEDAMRAANYLLTKLSSMAGLPAADEADDGTTPIADTNDGIGLLYDAVSATDGSPPLQGHTIAALAESGLAGTVAQAGNSTSVQGRPLEHIVQQMVDFLVYAQIDASGAHNGGWYYSPNGTEHYVSEMSRGAHLGLYSADAGMGADGVYVNDRVRSRLNNAVYNSRTNAATGGLLTLWRNNGTCTNVGEFHGTADAMVAMGMLEWNTFNIVHTTPIPGSSITQGQARAAFNGFLNGLAGGWVSYQAQCFGWASGLFYNDGGTNQTPYLRTDGKANLDALFALANGIRSLPSAQDYAMIGGHDWEREFTTYLVRNQFSDGHWMDTDWGVVMRTAELYGEPITTAYGGLVLAPGLLDALVAHATAANPAPVCGSEVSFNSASFHNDPQRAIVTYEWDFDYDGSFSADATGPTVSHTYFAPGNHTARLRVTDDAASAQSDVFDLAIAVQEPVNVSPVADAGGPYQELIGETVQLDGSGSSDPNEACGDAILAYDWDLDNDGQFDDATGALPSVAWDSLADLGLGPGTHPISLRVSDGEEEDVTGSTLTIDLPELSVGNARVTEGDRGTHNVTLDVTLSEPVQVFVELAYKTADRSAEHSKDYTKSTGELAINPGEAGDDITVEVWGDRREERNETFFVKLMNLVNAAPADVTGKIKILDDD